MRCRYLALATRCAITRELTLTLTQTPTLTLTPARAHLAEELDLAADEHHVLRPHLPPQQPAHAPRRARSHTGLRGGNGTGGTGGTSAGASAGARSVWRRSRWLSKGAELVVGAQDQPVGDGRRRRGGGGASPDVLPLHGVHDGEELSAPPAQSQLAQHRSPLRS